MNLLVLCITVAYSALLIGAAACDVARLKVPNTIPSALVVLFGFAAWLSPHSVPLLSHLVAIAIVLAVGMGLYASGKIGGGDVKLIAALSLWSGLPLLPLLLFAIAVSGFVVAVVIVGLRAIGAGYCLESLGIRLVSLSSTNGVPYAVAISCGGLAILPHAELLFTPLFN